MVEKRLKPFMMDAKVTKGKGNAPSCYKLTNKPKERPDVWITDPLQSIVVEVTHPSTLLCIARFVYNARPACVVQPSSRSSFHGGLSPGF